MSDDRKYLLDYISDRTLFKAVMFARQMMREGTSARRSNAIAAKYYGKDVSDVARYTGQVASRCRNNRRSKGDDKR